MPGNILYIYSFVVITSILFLMLNKRGKLGKFSKFDKQGGLIAGRLEIRPPCLSNLGGLIAGRLEIVLLKTPK